VLSGIGVAVGTLVGLGGGAVGVAVDAAPQAEMNIASTKKHNNIIILRSLFCFIRQESVLVKMMVRFPGCWGGRNLRENSRELSFDEITGKISSTAPSY
jgi:hypothetical protein